MSDLHHPLGPQLPALKTRRRLESMKMWTTPSSLDWSRRPNLSWVNIWRWDWNFKWTRQFNNQKWLRCYLICQFCEWIIINGLWKKLYLKHWRVSIPRSLIPCVMKEKGRGNDCSKTVAHFGSLYGKFLFYHFSHSLEVTFIVYSLPNSLFNNLSPNPLL